MLTMMLLAALMAEPEEKAAEKTGVPQNFVEYFERADKNKAGLVDGKVADVERAKIALNSASSKEKADAKKLLAAQESELRAMRKMKPFLVVDHEATNSIGYFFAIGTDPKLWHSSGNVLGVIDAKTVVVASLGRGNKKITTVLKVESTRNMTRDTRIGATYVSDYWLKPQKEPWIVTGLNGLDDDRVSALLRLKAGDDSVPILEQLDAGDLEKHRKAFDAAKAEKP